MNAPPLCPACRQPVSPGDAVCFHCRAVLDPFTRGARIASRYVIEESIGQGGMGRVYRAYDEVLHEKVAIKTLLKEFSNDPQLLARFRDEVRLARRVAHPNVCRVHDYVDHAGTPFLSMEWVDGETLAARLRRLGPRPEAELQAVRSQVIDALRALWSNGIVHRDLKPANLMWTREGRVKVMDFGLARALAGSGDRERTSGVVGSPEYLSPEQIRGETATERSDTYALGVTLFELATGRPPFRGTSPAETLMKHLSEAPDALALSGISESQRSFILQSLEKKAEARPDLREDAGDRTAIRSAPRNATLLGVGLVLLVAAVAYRGSRTPPLPGPAPASSPIVTPIETPLPATTLPNLPSPATTPISGPTPLKAASPSPAATPEVPATIAASPVPLTDPVPSPSAVATPTPAPVIAAPTPTTTPAPKTDTRLVLVVKPWADVFVDGESKGQTPLAAFVLAPGSHVVELRHKDFRPFFRTIELKAGELFSLTVDLRLEGVRR